MLPSIYEMFQHWGKQTVWIYSDPHFGDEDLASKINRPSDEEQIKMINSCVGKKDTLIILGDVGDIECVRKLRAGYKVLIMGNHDAGITNYQRKDFHEEYNGDEYSKQEAMADMAKKYPNCKLSVYEAHSWDEKLSAIVKKWHIYADNMLFDEVYEGALIIGEKLILSHEPVEIPWLYNIHGHDHSGYLRTGHTNVCSDVIGYKPINFNQWLKEGHMSRIQTIHRACIDNAIERKKKRGGKKIGQR